MKHSQFFILIIVAVLAGMLGPFLAPQAGKTNIHIETAVERVLRTGILKCGYGSWEPMVIINPNTKKITGIAHDIIELAAQKIGVKVEWTEEVGWAEFAQAMNGKRFDVFCTGFLPTVPRERVVDFTIPIAYSKESIWSQTTANMFDNHIDLVNQPSTRIVFVDGTVAASLIQHEFPKAHYVSLPELTPIANIFQELAANKADITVMDEATANDFIKKNPGKIKLVKGGSGYRVFPNKFAVAEGEYGLQQLLNSTLDEMQREGTIDKILKQYEPLPGSYYRTAKAYYTGEEKHD